MSHSFAKIRKLPINAQCMIDKKNIPPNTHLYNPSKAGKWIYIRKDVILENRTQLSNILLYNEETKAMKNIDSPLHLLEKTHSMYKGLEDLRICQFEDRIWFSASCTHASAAMNSEIVIGFFNEEMNAVEKIQYIDLGSSPIKNVLPFVHADQLVFIDTYKMCIYALKRNDDADKWYFEAIVTLRPAAGISYKNLRTSTSPIHLHGSIYGCVVHTDIANDSNRQIVSRLSYIHYWYEFDMNTGLITFVSTPFWLLHWGIEYVSGIHKKGSAIELFVGVDDKIAYNGMTTLTSLRFGK